MNIQERLELILDERRRMVGKLTPAEKSRLLHDLLGDWLEEARGDDSIEEPLARDEWLVRIAGACLYLMHPEDELAHVTVDSLPLPAPASQDVAAGLAKALGEYPWRNIILSDHNPAPDATVVRRGDGTYKRKPRPDVTG